MVQENARSKIQRQSTSLLFVDWVPQVNGSSCGSTILLRESPRSFSLEIANLSENKMS